MAADRLPSHQEQELATPETSSLKGRL
jgi:hypothetical protein